MDQDTVSAVTVAVAGPKQEGMYLATTVTASVQLLVAEVDVVGARWVCSKAAKHILHETALPGVVGLLVTPGGVVKKS